MQKDIMVLPPSDKAIYQPSPGQYGISTLGIMHWYHCREMYHTDANMRFWKRGFYFSLPKDNRTWFCDFFNIIEEQLHLKKKSRFFKTNMPGVLYIEPASFWHKQWMRYSLFTILCRAGMAYDPSKGMEAALRSNIYIKMTYRAVQFFLAGRTRYTGFSVGWVNAFAGIPCVARAKCNHKDRRCRKELDSLLVPNWQVFPISLILRIKRKVESIWQWLVTPKVLTEKAKQSTVGK